MAVAPSSPACSKHAHNDGNGLVRNHSPSNPVDHPTTESLFLALGNTGSEIQPIALAMALLGAEDRPIRRTHGQRAIEEQLCRCRRNPCGPNLPKGLPWMLATRKLRRRWQLWSELQRESIHRSDRPSLRQLQGL